MWSYLLIPLLAASQSNFDNVVEEISPQCETGTLIFSQGDCLAVKVFSRSRFTHCGAVVMEDDHPVVYDSMNGVGVRKLPLENYLELQSPNEIHVLHPAHPLSAASEEAFVKHLRSQLGRPYAVKHHVTGNRAKGVHCSEYCTDALMAAGIIEAVNPPRVSPGSLFDGLTIHLLYADGGLHSLPPKSVPPPVPDPDTWYCRAWRSTSRCTRGCCQKLSGWFLCSEK